MIRCVLVSVSVKRNPDNLGVLMSLVLTIMSRPMMKMLMQRDDKSRRTAGRPQEGADRNTNNETPSHSTRVSHRFANRTTAALLPGPPVPSAGHSAPHLPFSSNDPAQNPTNPWVSETPEPNTLPIRPFPAGEILRFVFFSIFRKGSGISFVTHPRRDE